MLHQQDGHPDQHSPVERILHYLSMWFWSAVWCILRKKQPVTVDKSWKVLFFKSPILLSDCTASTNAALNKVPPSAVKLRCRRQASGKGKHVFRFSFVPKRSLVCRYPCTSRTVATLNLKKKKSTHFLSWSDCLQWEAATSGDLRRCVNDENLFTCLLILFTIVYLCTYAMYLNLENNKLNTVKKNRDKQKRQAKGEF